MSIEATVENFISNELLFGQSRTQIDPDQDLINSGLLDSVAILRLILFIEEQFGVRIEDGEVLPDNFRTINLVKSFVQAKQGVSQPAS
jgi:acyl carrier protein